MNNNTSSIVPFEYEGRQIRVISDELGDPWFVAADLLASLALDRKAWLFAVCHAAASAPPSCIP